MKFIDPTIVFSFDDFDNYPLTYYTPTQHANRNYALLQPRMCPEQLVSNHHHLLHICKLIVICTTFSSVVGPRMSAKSAKSAKPPPGPPKDDDEGLTQDKLNQLHDLFEEMDEDGGGGLDMDEFKNAMRQTMGNISDKEIELIFMKVSINYKNIASSFSMEHHEQANVNSSLEASLCFFARIRMEGVLSTYNGYPPLPINIATCICLGWGLRFF